MDALGDVNRRIARLRVHWDRFANSTRGKWILWTLRQILTAAVVGYLGSPDPVAFRVAAAPNLRPALAVGLAVGLLLGYEALRVLLATREDRAA